MTKKEKSLSPEQAALEWIECKTEKARIEKRIDELKDVLEPFLDRTTEKSAELHGWKFTLIQSERESFSLSRAREKIDGRVLAPYVTISAYSQIRTTWKGGEESEVA